ncbi:hypothetical protein CLOM_g22699 [Closterium sp. NIES-68]|nr:hypothetical protein CLOM_g22699 [Closterium sp. NIES-68]
MTCFKDIHTHLLLTISATTLVSKATRAKYNLPDEPVTIEEALSGPYHKEWRKAIQEELDTLAERGTWVLKELPEERRPVGVRWIFKIKTGDLGQLERFKARLGLELMGYADASHASDKETRRGAYGYVYLLAHGCEISLGEGAVREAAVQVRVCAH